MQELQQRDFVRQFVLEMLKMPAFGDRRLSIAPKKKVNVVTLFRDTITRVLKPKVREWVRHAGLT
jgi:hypothetical protein